MELFPHQASVHLLPCTSSSLPCTASSPGTWSPFCSGEVAHRGPSPQRATKHSFLPSGTRPGKVEQRGIQCVFPPLPGTGPQQVPAQCLLICSINTQLGEYGSMCVLPYVCVLLCAWVCTGMCALVGPFACICMWCALACGHGCVCVVSKALSP